MAKIRKDIPLVSGTLAVINIVMFLLSQIPGNTLWQNGLLGAYEVVEKGEYGRLFYSMFLHVDIEHLFNNMIILFFLGAMLEKEVGHFLLLLVYMLSGLAGNVLSIAEQLAQGESYYSLGASGGVFGLDGLLLAMVIFAGKRFPDITLQRVAVMLLLSLYTGMRSTGVNNTAHVGGLIAGFLVGVIICFILYRKDRRPISEY